MRSSEIRGILTHFNTSLPFQTVQVCACNELPREVHDWQKPALFIANTDPNYRDGSHWVAIVLFKRCNQTLVDAYFFDPLGFSPSHYDKSLTNLLRTNSSRVSRAHSCLNIQPSDSVTCGYYCTYFALNMSQHALNPFSTAYAMFHLTESQIVTYVLHKWQCACQ